MADSQDVAYAIVHALDALVTPLIGTKYAIPEAVDQQVVGATQVVPPTTYALSRPLQKDLEDRLAAAKAIITVEPDEHDVPATQYVNEGRKMDFVGRVPVTLTTTPTNPLGSNAAWTLGGAITPGNIIGVQCGPIGATYVVAQGDSLASIAAQLAANGVTAGIATTASGNVFAAPWGSTVQVGAPSTWLAAVSRRARSFDVLFWLPDPHLRHYLLTVTEALFKPGQKLTMTDGSVATVIGTAGSLSFTTKTSDAAERDNLFLARTRWLVEFTVTRAVTKAPIVAVTFTLDPLPLDTSAPLLASQL